MPDPNRRRVLALAGAGAAAGVAAIAGGAAPAQAATMQLSTTAASEPVVAFIRDHRSHEVSLMVGETEVVVHDADLARRILNAAGGR